MTTEPITLTVRKVDIDFSKAKIHWNPKEPEYAQLLNGLSSGFPLLEPFLHRPVLHASELTALALAHIELALARRQPEQGWRWYVLMESAEPDNPQLERVRDMLGIEPR